MQRRSGESLLSFIQQFSQVHNIIPRISNVSVVIAFLQGVRDEMMLEKLVTHDIQDIAELFSLAEGRGWHMPPALEAGKAGKPDVGVAIQGSGNNDNNNNFNKNKASGNNQLLAGAPTTAAATATSGGR
jgi:hypothetical protein